MLQSLKNTASGIVAFFKDGTSVNLPITSTKIDISSSGSFSASQPVLRLTKIGKQVTLIFPSLAHSSSATPASATGIIPIGYRPPHTVTNIYTQLSTSVNTVAVGTSGTISFEYRDWTGATVARTDTQPGTLTWNTES